MQERGLAAAEHDALRGMLAKRTAETPARLQALWALHATGGFTPLLAMELLSDADEYVRAWAVRLICEEPATASPGTIAKIAGMSRSDSSPFVCLHLASAAQRLPGEPRWTMVENLASRNDLAGDANLPLMTWYALEPLCKVDPERALRAVARSRLPRIREFAARRIASTD
jgi:hypothetical protein